MTFLTFLFLTLWSVESLPSAERRVRQIVPPHPDLVPDVEVPDLDLFRWVILVENFLQDQARVGIATRNKAGHASTREAEDPEDWKKKEYFKYIFFNVLCPIWQLYLFSSL